MQTYQQKAARGHRRIAVCGALVFGSVAWGFLFSVPFVAHASQEILRPSANGSSTQWTAVGGTNYATVDDVTHNSDSDYVKSSDNAFVDNYNLPGASFSSGDTVNSVKVTAVVREASATGFGKLRFGVRTGGINFYANSDQLITSYQAFENTWSTNPSTGQAWTKEEIDDLQIAIRLGTCVLALNAPERRFVLISTAWASATQCTLRVTQVYVTVDYTVAEVPSAPAATGGAPLVPGKIVFSGKAFPGGKMVLYEKETPLKQSLIESADGSYLVDITLPDLEARRVDYRLLFIDREGRATPIRTVARDISVNQYFLENVFPPPTLSLERAAITKGSSLLLVGSTLLGSDVEVFIDGRFALKVKSGSGGRYAAVVNTEAHRVAIGNHTLGVRWKTSDGKTSELSLVKRFIVSPFGMTRGDFNVDGVVDLRDWSIFVTKKDDPTSRNSFDLNGDGAINVQDVSVFLSLVKR